jgi:hypothetical protein
MQENHGTWVRSTRCESGTCVEVKVEDGMVHVRDSARQQIKLDPAVWSRFLTSIRDGGDFVSADPVD